MALKRIEAAIVGITMAFLIFVFLVCIWRMRDGNYSQETMMMTLSILGSIMFLVVMIYACVVVNRRDPVEEYKRKYVSNDETKRDNEDE